MSSSTSIVIPASVFRSLPIETQEALIAALRGDDAERSSEATVLPNQASVSDGLPASPAAPPSSDEALDGGTDLSPVQFKKILEGCGPKTRAALRAMVE